MKGDNGMKVVFLDFDGVLNSDEYVRRCGRFGVILNPAKMDLLKELIDATDANIVLSTSWREHWGLTPEGCDAIGEEINRIFRQHALKIFDKVPHRTYGRVKNIQSWLQAHPEVTAYVVLDDQFLDGDQIRGHFVKTSNLRGGLSEEDVRRAIDILKGESHV